MALRLRITAKRSHGGIDGANRSRLCQIIFFLKRIVESRDLRMLARDKQAEQWDRDPNFLAAALADLKGWRSGIYEEKSIGLIVSATAKVMRRITEEAGAYQLLGTTDVSRLVANLSNGAVALLRHMETSTPSFSDDLQCGLKAAVIVGCTDLLRSLTEYTQQIVLKALQHLGAQARQFRQQQQQQQQQGPQGYQTGVLLMQCCHAVHHAENILDLWGVLLKLVPETLDAEAPAEHSLLGHLPAALQAAADLASDALPLLNEVAKVFAEAPNNCSTSDNNTSPTPQPAAATLKAIQHNKVALKADAVSMQIVAVIAYFRHQVGRIQQSQQHSQQQSQLWDEGLTKMLLLHKLPKLLLTSLAARLQMAGLSSSLACGAQTTSAACSSGGQQPSQFGLLQARLGQYITEHPGLVDAHDSLMAAVGQASAVQLEAASKNAYQSLLAEGREIIRVFNLTLSGQQKAGSSSSRGRRSCISASLHSSTSPDELPLPATLISYAIKTLLETASMLPADDVSTLVACLEGILLLLDIVAATAYAAHCQATADQSAAASAATKVAAVIPWPVLPAKVAAKWLHPVVQDVSRVVVQALQNTEPKQQQQQQQLLASMGDASNRLSRFQLLHVFGKLLMSVCEAVEPKLIAAALSRDPVNSLVAVAIEAVIRHEAAAATTRLSKQKAQAAAAAATVMQPCSTRCDSNTTHALCDDPVELSILQLLPCVTKLVTAVSDFTESEEFLAHQSNTGDALGTLVDVLLRVASLVTTAGKIGRLAAEQYREEHQATSGSTGAKGDPAAILNDFLKGRCNTNSTVTDWYLTGTSSIASATNSIGALLCQLLSNSRSSRDSNIITSKIASSGSITYCSALLFSLPIKVMLNTLTAAAEYSSAENSRLLHLPLALDATSLAACCSEGLLTAATCYKMCVIATQVLVRGPSSFLQVTLDLLQSIEAGLAQAAAAETQRHWQASATQQQSHDDTSAPQLLQAWVAQQQQLRQFLQVSGVQAHGSKSYACFAETAVAAHYLWSQDVDLPAAVDLLQSSHGVVGDVQIVLRTMQDFAADFLEDFPVPFCCNNPSCVNLSKLSEYQLVSGDACVCGGCKVARYCSRECQKQHWKQHKRVCSAIL